MKGGDEQTLAPRRDTCFSTALLLIVALLFSGVVAAQTMYKYRGENGEWIFSDRPPASGQTAETRSISSQVARSGLTVTYTFDGSGVTLTARLQFHAPMEVAIEFESIEEVEYPPSGHSLRWLVPARSELVLLELPSLGDPVALGLTLVMCLAILILPRRYALVPIIVTTCFMPVLCRRFL